MMSKAYVIVWILGAALGGFLANSGVGHRLTLARVFRNPLPHLTPKSEGGITLHFAMVHDVIHERFPRHGAEYYRHRNAVVAAILAKGAGSTSATRPAELELQAMDDLAVGCVHLGEFERAIQTMRDKLEVQKKAGMTGRSLYSTFANLGTAMMIDALTKASNGQDAGAELQDSLTWVRQSVQVNPNAHFGREAWQVALGEYLLNAAKDPALLTDFDMIGDRLAERETTSKPYINSPRFAHGRSNIMPVGAEGDWEKRVHGSQTNPVPFDEPALGIIGMWRYGGGANVHFSLALAEIMLRVGQRPLAWCAFERTARLAESARQTETSRKLIEHCRRRQASLEAQMPENSVALRNAFDADLQTGLKYQAAYQKYEDIKITQGASIDDPHFYDDFFAEHEQIASDPGHADEETSISTDIWPPAILFGGFFVLLFAAVQAIFTSRASG